MEWNRLRSCVLVLTAALVSCGGGGGGSGSSSGSSSSSSSSGGSGNIRFAADRTTVTFDYIEGGVVPSTQNVIITATGSYSGTLYLGATATGQGIDTTIPLTIISDTQGQFAVRAASNLPVGAHTGSLQFMACSDQNCTRQVGNSPITVTYTTTVHTTLHVSTDTVNLTAVSGNTTTQDVTVTLPWQSTNYTMTVDDPSWLTVTSPTPTTLRLTTKSIPVSNRQNRVVVSSGGYSRPITVNYNVTAPPGGEFDLRTNPTSISLTAIEGATSQIVNVSMSGPTWDPLLEPRLRVGYPTGNSSQSWLNVTRTATGYQVRANAIGVTARTYQGSIVLEADAPAHSVTIPVTLTVGVGLATPADVDVTIDSNTTLQSTYLSGSVPTTSVTGVPIQWTTTQFPYNTWLTVTPGGTTGTNVQYVINPTQLDLNYTPHGEYWSEITLTPSIPTMTPVKFRVNVHKRLAQIFSITPYFQVQNTPSRHIIRGRNFIANRDWGQKLMIMFTQAGGRVTRVNDTKMILDLEPQNWSEMVINPTSELASEPGIGRMVVIPPRNFAYAKIPTGYNVQTLIYNQRRGDLYALERHYPDDPDDRPRAFQYAYNFNAWGSSSAAQPGLRDMFEDIDGLSLLGVGTQGFQAVTFNGAGFPHMPYVGMYVAPYGSNIIQTNDRRTWFATATRQLAYFDYPSGEVVLTPHSLTYGWQGPWFAKSGDSDNLIISMTQAGSSYPAQIMSMTDYTLRQVPASSIDVSLINGSVSETGSRSVTESARVRDAGFGEIGTMNINVTNWVTTAYVVSRDGRRGYAYAFDFADFHLPNPTRASRIYVFDLTTPAGFEVPFPTLGYFTLPDYPGCMPGSADCSYSSPKMQISPDNRTLFLAGNQNLIVAPIPAENTLATNSAPPRVNKQRLITTPWRVNTRAQ